VTFVHAPSEGRKTKGKKSRFRAHRLELMNLLREPEKGPSDQRDRHLFTWHGKEISRVSTKLRDRARGGEARDNVSFHTLRHTFASWYMINGGDLYQLKEYLGHSTIALTQRYAHLSAEHQAAGSGSSGRAGHRGGGRQGVSEPTFEEALHDLRTNHASDQHASCDPDQVCLYRDDEDLVAPPTPARSKQRGGSRQRKDAHVAELHQGCGGRHSNQIAAVSAKWIRSFLAAPASLLRPRGRGRRGPDPRHLDRDRPDPDHRMRV